MDACTLENYSCSASLYEDALQIVIWLRVQAVWDIHNIFHMASNDARMSGDSSDSEPEPCLSTTDTITTEMPGEGGARIQCGVCACHFAWEVECSRDDMGDVMIDWEVNCADLHCPHCEAIDCGDFIILHVEIWIDPEQTESSDIESWSDCENKRRAIVINVLWT